MPASRHARSKILLGNNIFSECKRCITSFFNNGWECIDCPFCSSFNLYWLNGKHSLATVLNANGVFFAGIIGFIYSDLMVPPLVNMNSKYYGTKTALYIAGVMFVSIVITALVLNYSFEILNIIRRAVKKFKSLFNLK